MRILIVRTFTTVLLALELFSGGNRVVAQAGAGKQPAEEYNRIVGRMSGEGTQAAACADAEKLARSFPSFAPVFNLLGICSTNAGQLEKAESFFRRSVALAPGFTEARNNLAVNLLSRGKAPEARRQLLEVIRLEPRNVTARFNLGKADMAAGKFLEAVENLRTAHEQRPGDPSIVIPYATALHASGQPAESRRLIAEMAKSAPPAALLSAGIASATMGEDELTNSILKKALSTDPKLEAQLMQAASDLSGGGKYAEVLVLLSADPNQSRSDWHRLYGYASYKLGRPEAALEHLRKAIELGPDEEINYLHMAEFLLFHNSDSAAAAFLKAGLERLPNSPRLHASLAMAGLARGMDPEMSVREAETAVKHDPTYVPALSLLCLANSKLKQWDRLEETAGQLVKLSAGSAESYYYQGLSIAERVNSSGPKAQQGLGYLRKATKLNPEFADAHFAIGKLLFKIGQTEESIVALRKAAGMKPPNSEAYYQLSRVLQKAGRSEEARSAMNEYKRLHDLEQEKYGKNLFTVQP